MSPTDLAVSLAVAPAAGLAPAVVAAVLVAAVAHASWNAIAHGITDKLIAFTLVCCGGAVCALAVLPFTALPKAGAWPYLLISVGIHLAYLLLLMQSFRLGDFGQTYPIARGTAPLVVTVLAAVFVHEYPDGMQVAGVAVASVGLASIALLGWRRRPAGDRKDGEGGGRPSLPAVLAALGTGLAIAAYTTVDGVGVRKSGDAAGYTAWLMLLQGLVIPIVALARHRRALPALLRPVAVRGLLGGALSMLAYGLVLWAQTRGALAPIAALRETSIIVGAILGSVLFHERFGRPRVIATVLVAAGIVLLNIG